MKKKEEEARDLSFYLNKIYGDRSTFHVEKSYQDYYYVVGEVSGEVVCFEINEEDGILFMYSNADDCSFMNKIVPVITTYMNGNGPIAKYNSVSRKTGKVIDTTIEWRSEFDERVNALRENNLFLPVDVSNVVIFVETREEKDRRLGLTALIPFYFPNGDIRDLDKFREMVQSYTEQDTFLAMKSLLEVYSKEKSEASCDSGLFDSAWHILLEHSLSFCCCDSEVSLANFDKKEYDMWSQKWDGYFTYEKRCEYMEARLNGEDVFLFRPEYVNVLKFKPRGMKI